MNSKFLSVFIVLVMISAVGLSFSYAQSKTSLTVRPGDRIAMWFSLSSSGNEKVILYPRGPSAWFRLPRYVVNLNNSTEKISFVLNVPDNAGDMTVLLRITAANSTSSKNLDWIIHVENGVVERANIIGLNMPSEAALGNNSYGIDVKNTGNTNLYNIRLDMAGLINKSYFKKSLPAGTVWKISDSFVLNQSVAPGNYSEKISVNIGGKVADSREASISVVPKPVIKKNSYLNLVILGYQRVLEIRNSGNANYTFSYSRNMGLLERLIWSGNGKIENGKVVWHAVVGPNSEYKKVDGYNILPLLVVLAILGLVAYWIYERMMTPVIKKRIVKKGDRFRVYIDIKNRLPVEITDVVVEDRINAIFKFSGAAGKIKTKVKKTRKHTKVLWMIPRLVPGEERILSYDMEFVLGVRGKMKLPSAALHGKAGDRVVSAETGKIEFDF